MLPVFRSVLLLMTMAVTSFAGHAGAQAGEALPHYQAREVLQGTLSSVGSDTLVNLLTLWSESFRHFHPDVSIQVQGAGSSTAPPALIEGTAEFGPMSRLMKDSEREGFEQRYGYPPTAIPVAVDALAVFVHKDNPLPKLTLPQIDAIFSSTRKCGHPQDLTRWGDLGLEGPLARQPLALFGRNSVSGTYGFFKERALCKGDFRPTVLEQPGSATVAQSVATAINGIGYSGIGYQTASIRAVPLATSEAAQPVAPTADNALAGQYPLARFLYLYINRVPGEPLNEAVAAFLDLVLSAEGQDAVARSGYISLPAIMVLKQRSGLGL